MTQTKTTLGPEQLEEYRRLLLDKRQEVTQSLRSLRAQSQDERSATTTGQELSDMPTHPADLGSDAFERDMDERLRLEQVKRLREIDEALRRIDEGTYGMCQADGQPISEHRLHARPWAAYCLQHADMQAG